MDTTFVFPRPQAPIPRPSPDPSSPTSSTGSNHPVNRESNALRASVLDVALQLGIGANSTVANWMFNNSLDEEEETVLRSPTLTYGSTPTSEESGSATRYPSTPPSSLPLSLNTKQPYTHVYDADTHSGLERPHSSVHWDQPNNVGSVEARDPGSNMFPTIPIPPRPVTPSRGKLRKKRADGYESDGGYVSDTGKKKKDKDRANADVDKKERAKEAKSRAKEEKMQEKKEKEEERKRKKSLIATEKAAKKSHQDGKDFTGYETDGTPSKFKSKVKSKTKSGPSGDVGYETDSGYLSSGPKAKTKTRFFKLGTKQSKPDIHQELVPNLPHYPVVEKESVALPIASKFATTLSSNPTGIVTSSSNTPYTSPLPISPLTSSLSSQPVSPRVLASTPTPSHPPRPAGEGPVDLCNSYNSAEFASASSTSSHERRREVQDIGYENRHGGGSGSYSTVTSASHAPVSPLPSASPTKARPAISLPLTHYLSSSPIQPSYSRSINSDTSSPIPSSKSLSPTPLSPAFSNSNSLSPSRAPTPSSGLNIRASAGLRPISPAGSTISTPSPRPRPRFPPTDGFGPRLTPSPQPSPSFPPPDLPSPKVNPSPQITQDHSHPRPHVTQVSRRAVPQLTIVPPTPYTPPPTDPIIPSSAFIVPSPRPIPLRSSSPNPGVLAYYDIPPPSPPPPGPLPRVPPPPSFPRTRGKEWADEEREDVPSRNRTPERGLVKQPSIQRGRQSPFPARPVLPGANGTTVGVGLEARVKVPRYRELYGLPLPRDRGRQPRVGSPEPGIRVVEPTEDGWDDNSDDEQDWEEEDMRDVLERFKESRMWSERDQLGNENKALGRSHSYEAVRGNGGGGSEEYEDDDPGRKSSTEGGWDKSSRWSGSVYSRSSFLDPETSGETRERFVQRVADMYQDGNGSEEQDIPPVPKLPWSVTGANTASTGRSWNRF